MRSPVFCLLLLSIFTGSACVRDNADYDGPSPDGGGGCDCDAPPQDQCIDAGTLRVYSAKGSCADHACSYAHWDVLCEAGCLNGACVGGDPCDGISCLQPPATKCSDASTLVTYASSGTCSMGSCSYAATQTACPSGCAQAECTGDACAGVTCTQPPASVCTDGSTLRSYGSGMCAEGLCTYAPVDTSCTNGCANGACIGDPCAGILCEEPPAPACVGPTTLRSYDTLGACANGSCTYTSFDTTCTPPLNATATCANGACGFTCAAGYVPQGAACVPQVVTGGLTWTVVATGTVSDFNGVWVSGDEVYAVGTGIILHSTDGGQTFASQTNTDTLLGVWGSGPSDVYVAGQVALIHSTDGGQTWASALALGCSAVWGSAASDVYALCTTQLEHSTDGGTTWSPVYTMTDTNTYGEIWGASASDVYAASWNTNSFDLLHGGTGVTWTESTAFETDAVWGTSATNVYTADVLGGIEHSTDGTTFTAQTSGSLNGLFWLWGSSASDIYAAGAAGTLLHCTDGQTWTPITLGATANFNSMAGGSATNVFIAGTGGVLYHGHD